MTRQRRIWAILDIQACATELGSVFMAHSTTDLLEAARLWDIAALEWAALGNRAQEAKWASHRAEQCRARAATQQKEAANV